MLDIGWPELVLIAVLTVVVIGPKELPVVLRALGRWVGKARALAREFRGSIEEIARESELSELKRMASGEELEKSIEAHRTPDEANSSKGHPDDERA